MAPARSRSTGSGSATNANILRLLKQLTSLQRWRASGRGETELGLGAQHRHRTTLTGPGDARTPRQGLTDLPRASGRERVGGGGGTTHSHRNRPRKLTYAVTRAPRGPGVGGHGDETAGTGSGYHYRRLEALRKDRLRGPSAGNWAEREAARQGYAR